MINSDVVKASLIGTETIFDFNIFHWFIGFSKEDGGYLVVNGLFCFIL